MNGGDSRKEVVPCCLSKLYFWPRILLTSRSEFSIAYWDFLLNFPWAPQTELIKNLSLFFHFLTFLCTDVFQFLADMTNA